MTNKRFAGFIYTNVWYDEGYWLIVQQNGGNLKNGMIIADIMAKRYGHNGTNRKEGGGCESIGRSIRNVIKN